MEGAYQVRVTGAEEARQLENSLRQGGLLVPDSSPPEMFSVAEVHLQVLEESWKLEGTVVNVHASGAGFYVHIQSPISQEVFRALGAVAVEEKATDENDPENSEEENSDRGRPTPAWDLIDPTSSEPIHSQVRKLSLAEKLKVARTATRPVRELLIRDSEKRIHAEVMRNPKLTDDEVVQYTSFPNLSPRVLEWVSTQTRFMRRRAVLLNIVQNPMTPPDTAKKLLSRLQDHELLRISRSSKIREVVSRAARKILMKKGVL